MQKYVLIYMGAMSKASLDAARQVGLSLEDIPLSYYLSVKLGEHLQQEHSESACLTDGTRDTHVSSLIS